MADTVGSFSDMLLAALGDSVDQNAGGYIEMLADDAVMEFPFAPPGLPRVLKGRDAIGAYLGRLAKLLAFERIGRPAVHRTADADVAILEFEGFGHGVASGQPYEQQYISVIRTSGGRIVHYRDYWNPLAILAALKGPDLADAVTVEGMGDG